MKGGYAYYLRRMQKFAVAARTDCRESLGCEDPAAYLCDRIGISPRLPLAKFIDEYNWLVITRRVPLPPKWHPDIDSIGT